MTETVVFGLLLILAMVLGFTLGSTMAWRVAHQKSPLPEIFASKIEAWGGEEEKPNEERVKL